MVTPPSVASPASNEPLVPAVRTVDAGRLGIYAVLGASAGAVPLPWIPDALARTIRGALVHDIAGRHRLSMTPQARRLLAEPGDPERSRTILQQAAFFVGARLATRALASFAPVALYWPAQGALRVYVLGRLFDRYLRQGRLDTGSRIEEAEARRLRLAIDGAWLGALASGARSPDEATAPEGVSLFGPRAADASSRRASPIGAGIDVGEFVDGVLARAAALPERVLHRIDRAFDEGLAHGPF